MERRLSGVITFYLWLPILWNVAEIGDYGLQKLKLQIDGSCRRAITVCCNWDQK